MIPLKIIAEHLNKLGATLIHRGSEELSFSCFRIMSAPTDELEDGTIYVCEPKVLPRVKRSVFQNHAFIFKASPSQLSCNHIFEGIVIDNPDVGIGDIVNELITLFSRYSYFEQKLNEIILGNANIGRFFDIAAEFFPDFQVVATDAAYNIIGSSKMYTGHNYIDGILERGYYNRDDLNSMASRGYYEQREKYYSPVFYQADFTVSRLPWLVRSFLMEDHPEGFVGCYILNKDAPSEEDVFLFRLFSDAMYNYLRQNYLSGSYSMVQQVWSDLLDGSHRDVNYIENHCQQLSIPFSGPFRFAVVKTGVSSSINLTHIANQLKYRCPVPNYGFFIYNDCIIGLIRHDERDISIFDDDNPMLSNWKLLENQLKRNNAQMGISLSVQNAAGFASAYKLALAALSSGAGRNPQGSVFFYSDYYLDHFLDVYDKTVPLEDCYMRALDNLRKPNFDDDISILYNYLMLERNTSLTAKKMFMHRNSVIYRLQKIDEKLGMDLDDPAIRLRIILSIKIMEKIGLVSIKESTNRAQASLTNE